MLRDGETEWNIQALTRIERDLLSAQPDPGSDIVLWMVRIGKCSSTRLTRDGIYWEEIDRPFGRAKILDGDTIPYQSSGGAMVDKISSGSGVWVRKKGRLYVYDRFASISVNYACPWRY